MLRSDSASAHDQDVIGTGDSFSTTLSLQRNFN